MSKNIEAKDVLIKESIVLRDHDPVQFTQKLEQLIKDGCEIAVGVMPRYKTLMMEVALTRELSLEDVKDGKSYAEKNIHGVVVTVDPRSIELPKETLDNLSWEALKALCSIRGITGRDRQKITSEFMSTYGI